MSSRRFAFAAGASRCSPSATPALAQGAVADKWRWLTFLVFGAIIGVTMFVTYLAAKRVKSAADFYTAGGGVSGLQNGWAIAGDYLSAASFLGIAGLISLYGYDGFMYSVGWLVAYITVLLVIAEPCRNIGKYTLSDILAYRNDPKATRIVGAISVITVSTFYLTAQMVGGGVLVKTLIGIDYEISVIVVGVLMLAYVLFGGMVATTWVQIIKAVLLVHRVDRAGDLGLDAVRLLRRLPHQRRRRSQGAGAGRRADLGDGARNMTPAELGQRFLEPGLLLQGADRPDLARHGAGVRHRRAAAHPDALLHRADGAGGAQVGDLGDGDHRRLLRADAVPRHGLGDERRRRRRSARSTPAATWRRRCSRSRSAAAPIRCSATSSSRSSPRWHSRRSSPWSPGSCSRRPRAMAHDLWVGVIRSEHVTPQEQVKAARIATVIVGALAIAIGIAAKGQNVAHLVALAFAVAASANFPCVLLTLYWKRCNTGGIVLGMIVGTLTAIGLVLVSPNMTYPKAVKAAAQKVVDAAPARRRSSPPTSPRDRRRGEGAKAEKGDRRVEKDVGGREGQPRASSRATTRSLVGLEKPLFELRNPGLISIPLGFLAVILGSLLYRDKRAEDMWDELYARQNTGILAAKAAAH